MALIGGFSPSDTRIDNAEFEIFAIKERLSVIEAALGIPEVFTTAQERIAKKMYEAKKISQSAQEKADMYRRRFEELEKELLDSLLKEE